MCKFRTLKPEEIDIRVGNINSTTYGTYASYLLYKDARVDMNILDETVGPMNWKKEYSRDNQNCTVSIYDQEKKEWISKEDTGTESFSEKEKGLASDSFKRACVCWGIGRELYTAPQIFINLGKEDVKEKNGKVSPIINLHVSEIDYDSSKNITKLIIKDDKGNLRFVFPKNMVAKPAEKKEVVQSDNLGTKEIFIKLIDKRIEELRSYDVDIFFDDKVNAFVKQKAHLEDINIEKLNNEELNRLSNVLTRLVEIKKNTYEKANIHN